LRVYREGRISPFAPVRLCVWPAFSFSSQILNKRLYKSTAAWYNIDNPSRDCWFVFGENCENETGYFPLRFQFLFEVMK